MNDVPSRDQRKLRVQAMVVSLALVATGLETLAVVGGAPTLQDFLLGLVAVAMVAAVIGG